MGRINVRNFKNEPLETLELEDGKNWYLHRPTEESRHKVQAVIEEHADRMDAYRAALVARMEEARIAAEAKGEDNPDAVARRVGDEEVVPLDVTDRYRTAAILAAHMKPVGLDPEVVLEQLGESLVNLLFERVTQETTGEAAKKALAGPGPRGI